MMTRTVYTLLLLALAGTAALAAPKRQAASRKPAPSKAPAAPRTPVVPSETPQMPTPASTTPAEVVPALAASSAASEVTLYEGKAVGPATLSVADWGGGSGQESTETYLFGGHSLKVTMLDLFQGARITFPTPVLLVGDNRVFQITLRRGGATLHYDPRTTSTQPPGEAPNSGAGQFGGGFGNPNQGQGRGQSRNGRRRRNQNGGPAAAPLLPPITNLRLSFTFADGRQSDILRPVPDASDALAGEGWYSVNVPISALKLAGGAPPLLKSVTVGGDHYGVFFVGRIKVGTDVPTLAITIDGPDSVLPGQPVALLAKGGSGFSALKYVWDLDGNSGGSDQATGEQVNARYFEGGQDHNITLTVTDLDGLKAPVTVTKAIHVKEQTNGPGFPPVNGPGFPPGNGPGFPPNGSPPSPPGAPGAGASAQ